MDRVLDSTYLDTLLDAAVDAVILADDHGRILRCNRAAGRLFGHDIEDLEGENVSVLMPPVEAGRHGTYMSRHLSTGETRIIGRGRELEGLRKDGSVFPLHLSVGRADTPDGPRFVAILHDLTRRRTAEQALERTLRLEAIGQMTGGIAHDFNNLLTLVIGNLEMVANSDATPQVRELVADALEAAELGADLTRRLLAFAGQSRMAPERLSPNQVIDKMAGLVRHGLTAGQRLDATLSVDVWHVRTDTSLLQSALVNLVRNAQDAMPEGVILITTENVVIDDDYMAQEIGVARGPYVRISVSDTGHGMDAETRKKALEPFFTTKPPGKGTGLGLATVYGYIRQTGGHVTIYSEPDQGSTISLYLPAEDEPAKAADGPRTQPALPGRGEHILVVEDDPLLRQLTGLRLESLGYQVTLSESADAAQGLLERGLEPEMVFTDMVMPGLRTGLDLAWALKESHPGLPVLLTTGYAGEMTNAELVDGFPMIRKPYRQSELADTIEAVLSSHRGKG